MVWALKTNLTSSEPKEREAQRPILSLAAFLETFNFCRSFLVTIE